MLHYLKFTQKRGPVEHLEVLDLVISIDVAREVNKLNVHLFCLKRPDGPLVVDQASVRVYLVCVSHGQGLNGRISMVLPPVLKEYFDNLK